MTYRFGVAFILLLFSIPLQAQVTNLTVNGSDSNFTMVSGSSLTWSFNLPVGGTADIEVWIDVEGNGLLDSTKDRLLVFLRQTDGVVSNEDNHIPDFDFLENGSIAFSLEVGLAPAAYIMTVTNNGSAQSITGLVTPLPAPAFTVSGTVSGPAGADLSYLVMDASRDDAYSPSFWNALTDSLGHYTIELSADTAGNPWWISIDNPPRGYLLNVPETTLTITGNHTGVDFTLAEAAAQVTGVLRDESGDSLPNTILTLDRIDPGMTTIIHWTLTDRLGTFWLGVPLSELNGNMWWLNQPYTSEPTTTQMMAMRRIQPFVNGDDLTRDLTVYQTNTTVKGHVFLNGIPPGFPIMMFAQNDDTARAWALSDAISGTFEIPVSDKISTYRIRVYNLAGSYAFPIVQVAPGDTDISFNIMIVGVDESGEELPVKFSLGRNYPNPFNPSTTIEYTVQEEAPVKISICDLSGRTVAVLLDERVEPGRGSVEFDGRNLPSGVYFVRMSAGTFTGVRKMLLLK